MVVKFNSQQKIVAVLAVRAGSQRVPKKNIRKFHDTKCGAEFYGKMH